MFRMKLIAAVAAWSAVTKKPNIIVKLCVAKHGDSGFPGQAEFCCIEPPDMWGQPLGLCGLSCPFLTLSSWVCGSDLSNGTQRTT